MAILNESSNPSILNYRKAHRLFKEIRELWDKTEEFTDYDYMESIDKIDDLERTIGRIRISDIKKYLEDRSEEDKLDDIKHNIALFKEAAYVIGGEMLGASYYDDLNNSVPKYIRDLQKKYKLKYTGDVSEMTKLFVSAITNSTNVRMYKSNIEAIIRGSMTLPLFSRLFDALVKDKKPRVVTDPKERHHPVPPEMFTPEQKKKWEETLKQQEAEFETEREERAEKLDVPRGKPKEFRKNKKDYIKLPTGEEISYDFKIKDKHGVVTYYRGDEELYTYLHEGFISLENYKKYHI